MTKTAPKLMPYKSRKRWALFLLLVGMPVYVVIVLNLMTSIQRLPFVLEALAYVVLGIIWIVPFKRVFLGVGQPDPDAQQEADLK
ncbi:MAG: DUF2842 domain-containing protein [Cypionkella sp.]|nr:DUF2842 domain-containing protein [Cypionkella sp.]